MSSRERYGDLRTEAPSSGPLAVYGVLHDPVSCGLFLQRRSCKSAFLFPVAVGLHYVATHLDSFMKPQEFIALTRSFMDCVETLEEASLATIKRIASYCPSSAPYCLTYCQGISCLQKIRVGTRETNHV